MEYIYNLLVVVYFILGYGVIRLWQAKVEDKNGLLWVLTLWPVVLIIVAIKDVQR